MYEMLTPERVPLLVPETTPRVLVNTESVQRKVKRDRRKLCVGINFVIVIRSYESVKFTIKWLQSFVKSIHKAIVPAIHTSGKWRSSV